MFGFREWELYCKNWKFKDKCPNNAPIKKKKKDGDFVHLAAVLKRGHELIPLSAGTSRFLLKKSGWLNTTHSYYC